MISDAFELLYPNFLNTINTIRVTDEKQTTNLHQFAKSVMCNANVLCKHFDTLPEQVQYDKSLDLIWGKCLTLSKAHAYLLNELCYSFSFPCNQEHIKEYVLVKLFASGLRNYSGSIVLLQNGYVYGSINLTRNLYELLCLMNFIKINDETVAQAFYDAGENPLDERNPYKWATSSGCFNKEWISLSDIRKQCNRKNDSEDSIYAFLCKFAHPSSQSVMIEIGDPTSLDCFTGQSIFGMEVPATNAGLFISEMLQFLPDSVQTPEFVTKAKFCREWALLITEEYENVAKKIAAAQSQQQ